MAAKKSINNVIVNFQYFNQYVIIATLDDLVTSLRNMVYNEMMCMNTNLLFISSQNVSVFVIKFCSYKKAIQ